MIIFVLKSISTFLIVESYFLKGRFYEKTLASAFFFNLTILCFRRVVINSEHEMPSDYGTTPGGTIFGTTPGGMLFLTKTSIFGVKIQLPCATNFLNVPLEFVAQKLNLKIL